MLLPVLAAVALAAFPKTSIEIQDVDSVSLRPVYTQFDQAVRRGDRLVLFRINSFGGSVFAGLNLIDHVADAKKRYGIRTQCVVGTKAMSMGLAILESEMCDERYALPHSLFLAHNGSSSSEGTLEDLLESADILKAINWALAEMIGNRLRIGADGYRIMVERYAWTFGAFEALKVGAIDGIVDPRSVPPNGNK